MSSCSRPTLGIVIMSAGVLLTVAALLLLFGPDSHRPSHQIISPSEAAELLAGQEAVILLDVRTQEEYAAGHIEDAILIPNTELARRAVTELPSKDALIILYCRSGNRSASAAKDLSAMGYTRVYDLGGIIDWPYELVS